MSYFGFGACEGLDMATRCNLDPDPTGFNDCQRQSGGGVQTTQREDLHNRRLNNSMGDDIKISRSEFDDEPQYYDKMR